jgi:copper resistance protein B
MSRVRSITVAIVASALGAGCAVARAQEAQSEEHSYHALHDETHGTVPLDQDHTQHAAAEEAMPTSASGHVAPPAPEHPMAPMSGAAMIDAMGMDDDATFGKLRFDRFERSLGGDASALSWDVDAWFGRDLDKLRIRSEGEHVRGSTEEADIEALWSHAIAPFWDSEVGVRQDIGGHANRTWLALGVQGLAPYWFELGATAYVGESGRAALRVEADYDLSLTQRLILQPRAEFNAYGTRDRAAGTGAGLSDAEIGLRLRYEIRREIAPYVGVEWSRRFGETADFAREAGLDASDTRWVVGIRIWY